MEALRRVLRRRGRLLALTAFAVAMFAAWLGLFVRTLPLRPRVTLTPGFRGECALAGLSAAGDKLVTCSAQCKCIGRWGSQIAYGPVQIWDTREGRLLHSFRASADDVLGIRISPDGRQVAVVDREWRGKFRWHEPGEFSGGQWVPPGPREMKVFGPAHLTLLDTATGEVTTIDEFSGWEDGRYGSASDMCFSADGGFLAYASSREGFAALWDVARQRIVLKLPGEVGQLAFSPDGRLLATCRSDYRSPLFEHSITVWDTTTGKKRAGFKLNDRPPQRMVFGPNGTLLAAARGFYLMRGSVDVTIWDIESVEERACIKGLKQLDRLDPGRIVVQTQDDSGSATDSQNFPTDPFLPLLAPIADMIAWSGVGNERVRISEHVYSLDEPWDGLAERFLGNPRGSVRRDLVFRDFRTNERVATIESTGRYMLSAEGRVLAMFSTDGIQIWDLPPHRPVAFLLTLAALPALLFTALLWWRLGR